MSEEGLVTLGLVGVAGLGLIPVVMVARVVIAMIAESRRARAAAARLVTQSVPTLGELSSTDGEQWFGEVAGLQIMIKNGEGAPTDAQAKQVRAILDDLSRLVEKSRAYLLSHVDCAWLKGGAAGFQPSAIEPEDELSFFLELVHPADIDGTYRVTFRDGQPIGWSRDD